MSFTTTSPCPNQRSRISRTASRVVDAVDTFWRIVTGVLIGLAISFVFVEADGALYRNGHFAAAVALDVAVTLGVFVIAAWYGSRRR